LEGMDKELDEETRVKILEGCGRNCASLSLIKKAQALKARSKDMDEFLDELSKVWNHLKREGDGVYVVYEKCYCPLVGKYPGNLSASYCNCSRGWIKEVFEKTLRKPVEVKLIASIKQGDKACKFEVRP